MTPYSWMTVATLGVCLTTLSGCYTAEDACEDFVDAVAACEGAPDDHYNQAWCDANADTSCSDRQYYECMEERIDCVNGEASTHPLLCQLEADLSCPG